MDLNVYKLLMLALGAEVVIVASLMTYANYRKLDELERYFSENAAVQRNKRYLPGNMPFNRMIRMSLISCFLTMPGIYIRDGDMTEQEFKSIPVSLKRWATWPDYLGFQLTVCLALWYFLKP